MAGEMLYLCTHAMDDPNRTTLVWAAALAAADKKFEARVALLGEGAWLVKREVAESIAPIGRTQYKSIYEMMNKAKTLKNFKLHC